MSKSTTKKKRVKLYKDTLFICAICGKESVITFDPLKCCKDCQLAVIAAEDEGGVWRSAYLSPEPRLVEVSGKKMHALLGKLLPQSNKNIRLDGSGGHLQDKGKGIDRAINILRATPNTLVLLGSGESAPYHDDVVWDIIEKDRAEAVNFHKEACATPLTVLTIGTNTHVHSLTPELRLIIESRAAHNSTTHVIWVNLSSSGLDDTLGYGSKQLLELLGDSKGTLEQSASAAAATTTVDTNDTQKKRVRIERT